VLQLIDRFGKAPGFAGLTFSALLSASLLCAVGRLDGTQYNFALGILLGAHFGGGVAVARRDNVGGKNGAI
jgi:hypothetical protein